MMMDHARDDQQENRHSIAEIQGDETNSSEASSGADTMVMNVEEKGEEEGNATSSSGGEEKERKEKKDRSKKKKEQRRKRALEKIAKGEKRTWSQPNPNKRTQGKWFCSSVKSAHPVYRSVN